MNHDPKAGILMRKPISFQRAVYLLAVFPSMNAPYCNGIWELWWRRNYSFWGNSGTISFCNAMGLCFAGMSGSLWIPVALGENCRLFALLSYVTHQEHVAGHYVIQDVDLDGPSSVGSNRALQRSLWEHLLGLFEIQDVGLDEPSLIWSNRDLLSFLWEH